MRKMSKWTALIMAGVMVCSLTACGQGSTGAGNADTATTESEQTTDNEGSSTGGRNLVISVENVSAEANELRPNYFDDPIKAAFPDDNITVDTASDAQSVQVQVAGGSGPDLIHLNGPTDAAEYAKAGRIVDLTPYAEKYGWDELFYDWAYGTSFYDGKLYSLPNSFEGMVLYFNTDVFEENGWEKPTDLDSLMDICNKCMEKGIIPFSFGNGDYQGAVDWLYSTFLNCYAGPDVMKETLQGNRKWTDPEVKGAMEQMVDWWQKGYIGDKKSQAISGTDMLTLFSNGDAAMMIDGTWASSTLLTTFPDCNWDVEVMPEIQEGIGSVLPLATGGCFVINSSCEDPDFAAEVLNYIFTGNIDNHIKGVVEAGMQPFPVKAVTADKFEGMDERMKDMYDALFDGQESGNVGFCAWTFFPSEVESYMQENTDGLFLGTLTVDDYLSQVQTLSDEAIATGNVPQLP